MRVGSLFSGIGGFDLGLEWAGMETVWQCENDPYARSVLKRHWPGVELYDDIRELDGTKVEETDLICGGFPCQDISCAGKKAGLGGERSGLFFEMARVVAEARPKYVLFENSPEFVKYLGQFVDRLRVEGYAPQRPLLFKAWDVGAWHDRERCFILAVREDALSDDRSVEHDGLSGEQGETVSTVGSGCTGLGERLFWRNRIGLWSRDPGEVADVHRIGWGEDVGTIQTGQQDIVGRSEDEDKTADAHSPPTGCLYGGDGADEWDGEEEKEVCDTLRRRLTGNTRRRPGAKSENGCAREIEDADAHCRNGYRGVGDVQVGRQRVKRADEKDDPTRRAQQTTESDVGGVASRVSAWLDQGYVPRTKAKVPKRKDRLKCLGNAVVPQVAEYLGYIILEYDRELQRKPF